MAGKTGHCVRGFTLFGMVGWHWSDPGIRRMTGKTLLVPSFSGNTRMLGPVGKRFWPLTKLGKYHEDPDHNYHYGDKDQVFPVHKVSGSAQCSRQVSLNGESNKAVMGCQVNGFWALNCGISPQKAQSRNIRARKAMEITR